MAKQIGMRTVEPIPGIKIVVWAQEEAGGELYSGRAVWGKDPVVTESSLGVIQDGRMPAAGSSEEAIALAVHDVTRLIRLGILESKYG